MSKSLAQKEFGATVAHYFSNTAHAFGKSLDRLLELTCPQPEWRMLDIATGAGHVAYLFAPKVAHVCATDITREMLQLVSGEISRRGLSNASVAFARAEALPFPDQSFDLVTCRIAPHHFDDVHAFLDEVRRVLKASALFGLVDNIVPAGIVGSYVNALDRLRDSSHRRALSVEEWRDALAQHGFCLLHDEIVPKRTNFPSWAGRHEPVTKSWLEALILEGSSAVKSVLDPKIEDEVLSFRQDEGVFLARPNTVGFAAKHDAG